MMPRGMLRKIWRTDWFMHSTVLVLMVMGVLFIYSAGYQSEDMPVSSFYKRQMLWAIVGIAGYITMAWMDYRKLAQAAWWIYAAGLFLLVLVFVVGREAHGATRWLSFFGMQVQPSELAKLAVILLVARYLSVPGRNTKEPRCTIKVLIMGAIPFFLVARQPDLGTAAVLAPMVAGMLFVGGTPPKHLVVLATLGVLMLPVAWFGLGDYQRERIRVFMDPGRDPLGAGWNKMQSEIAVGSGGLRGKGYLKGTQNILGFLPRTVAPTDFIYSVIAEETGFAGAALTLALYAALLATGLRAALVARDKTGRLIAVGVTCMVFFHVFINVAMTIGLVPITGLPLPLMSYGGSFMVSMMLALGLVQSIYLRRERR